MKKRQLEVYIAGSISRPCEQSWHKWVSDKLISMGYSTYAPAENKKINDKTNNPTPVDIYDGDVEKLLSCDVFLCELHGGKQDGTIWECGFMSGLNEVRDRKTIMIFYTSNTRLLNNASFNGIPSESLNHLVLGGFEKHGLYAGNVDNMFDIMEKLIQENEENGEE